MKIRHKLSIKLGLVVIVLTFNSNDFEFES